MPDASIRILDVEDIAKLLGVDERTIRRWRRLPRDPLPASRLGPRRLVFVEADVMAWVVRQREKPPVRALRAVRRIPASR